MDTKISELTMDELKVLISKTVQEVIEDYLEKLDHYTNVKNKQ